MVRSAKRKRVTMLVTVSVPSGVSAAHARREVKSLVKEQCFFSLDEYELKFIGVKAPPAFDHERWTRWTKK